LLCDSFQLCNKAFSIAATNSGVCETSLISPHYFSSIATLCNSLSVVSLANEKAMVSRYLFERAAHVISLAGQAAYSIVGVLAKCATIGGE
jgi:hypothetical protein